MDPVATRAPSPDAAALLLHSVEAGDAGDHRAGAALAASALAHGTLDPRDHARALDLLALHRLRLGDYEEAVARGLDALAALDGTGDLVTEARTHCTLALAFHETGLHEKAVPHVLAATETAHASGDATAQFWAATRTAMVHEAAGDLAKSVELERVALAIARKVDDSDVVFAGLNNLAMALLDRAEGLGGEGEAWAADAAACSEEALELMDRAVRDNADHPARAAHALSNLSTALVSLGRFDEAHAAAARATALSRANGYHRLELSCAASEAAILRAEGRTTEAVAAITGLLDLPETADEPVLLGGLHESLYQMAKELGDFETALHHHEEHHAIRSRVAAQTAGVQSRILLTTLEVTAARHEAESSRVEAQQALLRADDLEHKAYTDALTGLPNRRALDRELPGLVLRARSEGRPLAAAMIDLDHFKAVNDRHGHAVGDEALRTMAGILREATRERDLAIRTGGEEFLLVTVDATADQAAHACERLLDSVRSHPWGEIEEGLLCTVSAGVAALDGTEEIADWLSRADAALYRAKAEGRDQVRR